jgi:hypothetical protein
MLLGSTCLVAIVAVFSTCGCPLNLALLFYLLLRHPGSLGRLALKGQNAPSINLSRREEAAKGALSCRFSTE